MINHYEVIDVKQAKNKKIIMRVDFNVPMQDGKILDDTRIKRVIPGLKMLAASVITMRKFSKKLVLDRCFMAKCYVYLPLAG